ncbi:5323_t:CDS:2 [Entrophospora sp. SA101]|nr:5323_t:CDS:2 [Entrophospora sp. SA101]
MSLPPMQLPLVQLVSVKKWRRPASSSNYDSYKNNYGGQSSAFCAQMEKLRLGKCLWKFSFSLQLTW